MTNTNVLPQDRPSFYHNSYHHYCHHVPMPLWFSLSSVVLLPPSQSWQWWYLFLVAMVTTTIITWWQWRWQESQWWWWWVNWDIFECDNWNFLLILFLSMNLLEIWLIHVTLVQIFKYFNVNYVLFSNIDLMVAISCSHFSF